MEEEKEEEMEMKTLNGLGGLGEDLGQEEQALGPLGLQAAADDCPTGGCCWLTQDQNLPLFGVVSKSHEESWLAMGLLNGT
jgi:hypothetical protein